MRKQAQIDLAVLTDAWRKEFIVCGVRGVSPGSLYYSLIEMAALMAKVEFTKTSDLTLDAKEIREMTEDEARRKLREFAGVTGGDFHFEYRLYRGIAPFPHLHATMTYEVSHAERVLSGERQGGATYDVLRGQGKAGE